MMLLALTLLMDLLKHPVLSLAKLVVWSAVWFFVVPTGLAAAVVEVAAPPAMLNFAEFAVFVEVAVLVNAEVLKAAGLTMLAGFGDGPVDETVAVVYGNQVVLAPMEGAAVAEIAVPVQAEVLDELTSLSGVGDGPVGETAAVVCGNGVVLAPSKGAAVVEVAALAKV